MAPESEEVQACQSGRRPRDRPGTCRTVALKIFKIFVKELAKACPEFPAETFPASATSVLISS